MHELNEIARTIPNMGFAIFGIYMAHSLYKTPRKIYQCVFAWLSVYAFWIAIGIPLDAIFLNNPAFPDVTHERICMFIVPAAVLVYRYLFPQLSFANCVFSYFMVDNCLILLILFSRTLSEIICDVFSLSLNLVMIIVYLVLSAAFLLFYRLCLCRYIRGALGGFRGADMRLLAVFAVLAYFGTLFVVDVWAPWEKLTYKMVHHHFAAVLVPVCGYGMALRIASGQMRIRRLEKRVGYDPLTGLKNRTYLLEDAGNMLKKGYDPVQVLFLDLDSFKSINDNFGHFAGDNFCAALHAEARKSWGATARCTASAGMNLSCCTTEMTWTGCAVSWKRDSGMKTVRIFAASA